MSNFKEILNTVLRVIIAIATALTATGTQL